MSERFDDSCNADLDASTAAAWTRFQARLADHLLEMEEDDLLLLEAEAAGGDEGAAPYVQFCAWGTGELRCEAVSNGYLAPTRQLGTTEEAGLLALGFEAPTYDADAEPDSGSANFWVDAASDEADRLAVMAVRALRYVYGVAHPAFLHGLAPDDEESQDEAAAAQEAAQLLEPGGAAGDVADEALTVYPTDGPEHLQSLVDQTLTPVIGHAPVHDDDGDIPVECGDVVVFVRVLTDKPVVRLFACVASGIEDQRRAAFEVQVLNRDRPFFKFVRGGDAIFMQTDVLGWPFAPAHLRDLLDHMCHSVGQIHDDLAARLGRGTDEVTPDPNDDGELHPALATLLQLEADEPGSVDARLAAAICDHDRELILRLLDVDADLELELTKLLRGALRVTVERQARAADRRSSPSRHQRGHSGGRRRRVPDPTLEEVDPEMWG